MFEIDSLIFTILFAALFLYLSQTFFVASIRDFAVRREVSGIWLLHRPTTIAVAPFVASAGAWLVIVCFAALTARLVEIASVWPESTINVVLFVAALVLLEEAAFRGALLGFLLRRSVDPAKAVLVQALLFAAAHVFVDPTRVPGALVLGLVLGWLAFISRSLIFPFLCHFMANLATLFLSFRGAVPDVGFAGGFIVEFSGGLGGLAPLLRNSIQFLVLVGFAIYVHRLFAKQAVLPPDKADALA